MGEGLPARGLYADRISNRKDLAGTRIASASERDRARRAGVGIGSRGLLSWAEDVLARANSAAAGPTPYSCGARWEYRPAVRRREGHPESQVSQWVADPKG